MAKLSGKDLLIKDLFEEEKKADHLQAFEKKSGSAVKTAYELGRGNAFFRAIHMAKSKKYWK